MSLIKTHYKVNPSQTSDLELTEAILSNDEPLVLTGKIATMDDNKPLSNAITAKFGKEGSKKRSRPEAIETTVRELYPLHVITGWNVVDDAGNPVPYDATRCRNEVLADLDVYAVARIFAYFSNPDNFREALTKADGVDLGNASGT